MSLIAVCLEAIRNPIAGGERRQKQVIRQNELIWPFA
jgi:hypothetical protein